MEGLFGASIDNGYALTFFLVAIILLQLPSFLKSMNSVIKKKATAQQNQIDKIQTLLTQHIKSNDLHFRGQDILWLIHSPKPFSQYKYDKITAKFNEYSSMGGNGIVAEEYSAYIEAREARFSHLKQNATKQNEKTS